jgi:hypothetical protein
VGQHEALCEEQIASRVTLVEEDLFAHYKHAFTLIRDAAPSRSTGACPDEKFRLAAGPRNREIWLIG